MRKLRRGGAAAATPAAPAVQTQVITQADVAQMPAAIAQGVLPPAAPVAAVAPQVLPPAVPVPMAALAPQVLPPAIVGDASGVLAALTGNATLAAVGGFDRHEHLAQDGVGLPRLGFYHEKGGDAKDVINALGNVTVGTPFVKVEGKIYNASGYAFLSILEIPWWCTTNPANNHRPDRAWITPQPFGHMVQGNKVGENIDALILLLPGTTALHADLAPIMPALANFRGPRCPALRQHVDRVEETVPDTSDAQQMKKAAEWAQKLGPLVNLQPRFRLTSMLRIETKSSKNGPYAMAKADTAPISVAQYTALAQWLGNEELQEEFRTLQEGYSRKVAEINTLAVATT